MTTGYLSISGPSVLDGAGGPIVLRGVNLGGWMNYEGFILGHPGTETLFRRSLRAAIGEALYDRFSERLLDSFYADADAAYLASLGFNFMRIPVNYRHFESDERPFELIADGFRHLDRVVQANARHGIYSLIDLHAAQGWQNQGWHSDNPLAESLTWDHPHFQDRIAWLWGELASRYQDETWVAGYNLLNEPEDASTRKIGPLYARLMEAVRKVDANHLFFLDGNDWARDFDELGRAAPDVVYCLHQYPPIGEAGPVAYPGLRAGAYWDRAALEGQFLDMSAWIRRHGAPMLVGEFGPVDEGDPAIYASRMELLRDQLDIYQRNGAGWSYWTYKDIGICGIVRVGADTPWLTLLAEPIAKKRRLAADYWGTQPELAREVSGTFGDLVAREFPEEGRHPWGTARRTWQILGEKLLSELLMEDFVDCFRDLDGDDLDALADSFRFENCHPAAVLAEVLSAAAPVGHLDGRPAAGGHGGAQPVWPALGHRTRPARKRFGEGRIYAGFLLIGFSAQIVPALVRPIELRFGVSDAGIGALYFLTASAFAIGALGGGILSERHGRRAMLGLGLLLLALGGLSQGLAGAWILFMAAGALGAAAVGVVETASNAAILDLRPESRASALNLLNVFYSAGALGGPIIVGALIGAGLPWSYLMIATAGVAAALASWTLLPPARSHRSRRVVQTVMTRAEVDRPSGSPRLEMRPDLVLMGIATALYLACEMGISGWLARFFADLPISVATGALSLFWAAHATGRLAMVRIAHHLEPLKLAAICVGVGGIAAIAGSLSPHPVAAIALMGLSGLALGPVFPTVLAAAGASRPLQTAAVSGFLLSASIVGAIVYPSLMGVVADRVGLQPAMIGSGMLALLSGLALVMARMKSTPLCPSGAEPAT